MIAFIGPEDCYLYCEYCGGRLIVKAIKIWDDLEFECSYECPSKSIKSMKTKLNESVLLFDLESAD